MADLGRDEFQSWMELLREDIRGVHERLDTLNGRTRSSENRITAIETLQTERDKQAGKDSAARAGGFLGSVLGGAAIVWQYLK